VHSPCFDFQYVASQDYAFVQAEDEFAFVCGAVAVVADNSGHVASVGSHRFSKTMRNPDMKTFFAAIISASVALIALSSPASAQAPATAEARLKALNIALPPDAAPAANFVNSVQTGKLLFLSGNTAGPAWVGKGKLGKDLTVEQGREAARQAGLIMLTKIRTALGSLDRVKRVVKVLGMVNSAEGFGDQPLVVNGFSDLMVEVFGEAGKHARSAVGMAGLPGNSPIEVEMVVEFE
jgi:enamine deaminase RidA (YjgF/YER057c/UK114 family)